MTKQNVNEAETFRTAQTQPGSGAASGSARCFFCGHAENNEREDDGRFFWHEGKPVHNGCIKIYVLMKVLEELDERQAPNDKGERRRESAAPQNSRGTKSKSGSPSARPLWLGVGFLV